MRQGKEHILYRNKNILAMLCGLLGNAACEQRNVATDADPLIDRGMAVSGDAAIDVTTNGEVDLPVRPRFITGPELLPHPNPSVPLVAIVKFTTDQPVTAALEIRVGQTGRRVTFLQTDTDFSLPVLGLEPEQTFTVEVLISARGAEVRAPETLSGATEPLPAGFPPLETTISQVDKMEPGVILLNPFLLSQGSGTGLALAVNQAGRVIWFFNREEFTKNTIKRLANGNFILLGGVNIIEIDMLGNTIQTWHAAETAKNPLPGSTPVQAPLFHHDIVELPSGNFLILSAEHRSYDQYPTSTTDPLAPTAPAQVVGDLIIEMQRDGTIVNSWSLLDLLDPYRLSYSSLDPKPWKNIWPEVVGKMNDWSHANGLAYDEGEDAILVSIRHQDALIKFSRQRGELVWILGPHANWTEPWSQYLLSPQGSLEWPYHAHAPQITAQGTIMLFDNGNARASPYDPKLPLAESYSRAVEFAIDAQNMEVSQLWRYGGPGSELFFSSTVGSAYQLPQTGNILIADGNRATDQEGNPSLGPYALFWSRVLEVTRTTPTEKVFELVIKDETVLGPNNWRIYRSQKLPSLYPAQQARVEPIL